MKPRMAMIAATGLLAFSLPVFAQEAPPAQQGRFQQQQQRSADQIKTVLDLTDRQFTELNDVRDAHNKKLQELQTQLRDLDRQRRDAMSAGNDPAKVGSLALQIQSLQQQMTDENTAYHDNALRVLDSGQKEKVHQVEEAIKLAPQAGTLMQFGLLDTSQLMNGRGGFMGNPNGAMMMMRGGMGGAPPQTAPAEAGSGR